MNTAMVGGALGILLAGLSAPAWAQVLVGNSAIAPALDFNQAGQAEAFQYTATASGTVAALNVYVDGSSSAPTLVAGLYSNASGHPGVLMAQGSVASPVAGAWNSVPVSPTNVTAGTVYWIAILGPTGTLVFRDQSTQGGTLAENSAQTTLTSLPTTWSTGPRWSNGPASLYGGPPAAPPPGPDQIGSWSPLLANWPLIAAHSILMRTGTLLLMDGWVAPNPADLFDPASGNLTPMNNPFTLDLFCSGHTTLADGRVVIAGGHGFSSTIGINATTLFDPVSKTWTAGPTMAYARWYPTLTKLGDGRLVVLSGNITGSTWADTPEIYDPAANAWRILPGISTTQVHEEEYPLSFLLPSGKIFTLASSVGRAYELDPIAPSWGAVAGQTLYNGSAVMYLPGKILYSGGGTPLNSTSPAQAPAQVIDLTADTPAWQPTSSMISARYCHKLTVLPDGKVLAIGGINNMNQVDLSAGVLTSEQWDPATGQWTPLASMSVPRIYHSTAVLLPDGRVLAAGGGHGDGTSSPGEYNAQYFSPPYLFRGTRPTISSAPANATYGSTITVQSPDAASIASVVLISLAADTHTLDMNQHFVPLAFTINTGSLSVNMPSAPSLAPPGSYMLFLVNSAGIPSIAPFIQITTSGVPPVVTLTVPAPGPVSGNAVRLSATASDPTGITSVQFTLDGSPVGSPLTSSPYTMLWDSTTVANGSHNIGATALNGAGLSANAAPVSVTVSNTAPASPTVDHLVSAKGNGTQTTPAFNTTAPGDVLVAFGTSDGPGNKAQTLTISGAGLTWSLVRRVNARGGTTEIWTATAATTLGNITVKSTQSNAGYDQMLTVIAFSNTRGLGASATANAASGAPTVKITATAAGSLVYGAGNDYQNAIARTPGAGQLIVQQWVDTGVGDTYWVQAPNSPATSAGTVVTINDTAPTSDRWNMAAVEIVPR